MKPLAHTGYEVAESITFTVSNDKQDQKIEMKDKPILTDITLVKIDKDTKEKIKSKFTFGLYEDKECTKLIQMVDSNKREGTVTFEDLRYGTFYAKEISSPKNYKLSDKVVKIKINDKGVFVNNKEITADEDFAYKFEFENEKIPDVHTGITFSMVALIAIAIISVILMTAGIIYLKRKK